jgi:hypothetical protein
MKTRGLLLVCGLGLAAGGAIVSWRAGQERRAIAIEIEAVVRDTRSAERSAQLLEAQSGGAAQSSGSLAGARSSSASGPEEAAKRAAMIAALQKRFEHNPMDPAQQAASLRSFKEGLMLNYYALYRALGWNAAQIEKFEEILSAHEARDSDVRVTAVADKLGLSDPAIAQLRREETERFQAEIRSQFGGEALQKFEDYKGRFYERHVIGDLVGALSLGTSPLNPSQTQRIIAIVRETGALQRGASPALWDTVVERASGFLEPAQLEELRVRATAEKSAVRMTELSQMLDADTKAKKLAIPPTGG